MTNTATHHATVHYSTGSSAIGHVLVATGERGVCSISLGHELDEMAKDLTERFPNAQPSQRPQINTFLHAVIKSIENPHYAPNLPLDIQGTPFQQIVWAELRSIPSGQTRTYAQIALQIGRPTAVRAVGQACASNPLAVIIPCHRATGSGGLLTGYRWGVQIKRALLDHETQQETLFCN